jgi:hypothetical protein
MQVGLIVEPQASLGERFCDSFIQAFKLFLLVIGTYGLMAGMFILWYSLLYAVWSSKVSADPSPTFPSVTRAEAVFYWAFSCCR